MLSIYEMIYRAKAYLRKELDRGAILTEDTAAKIMVEFTEQEKRMSWLVCPKCLGQGIVYYPIGTPFNVINCNTSAEPFPCDVCNGKKIINHEGFPPK